ncbi:Small nuclear RNA activating complex (SNAPc), subunit SNAP43protein [Zostera marina]|uniref:Small nuclear RNA activating complex (SNAPc), subunit SNAP43protein n=1 Tax=Zostera marina TaxID=29655 RepID=A0A0K9P0D7_ZOSMR|nr:Small nuclear RNA activating complex (SNAPc), subunit SNAP43protein [Zostera marina]
MDLSPYKKDIDDLINEFAQEGFVSFSDMKRVWLSRKFSFIFENRPKTNTAVFMQALYAHSIDYMVSTGSLSSRLGGLYCLYCLYEIQPFKPSFKIYISIGAMRRLRELVIDAKHNADGVAPALVKQMLNKNVFLFGFVDISGDSSNRGCEEIIKLNENCVQNSIEKLLTNSKFDRHVHMDLGAELGFEEYKEISTDYVKQKQLLIQDAGKTTDVDDIKHIAEDHEFVKKLDDAVEKWDSQKLLFYINTNASKDEDVSFDDFEKELESLLDTQSNEE